ncbi:MAG: penicillin acylase family protein, partial [Actinomycetota bacterium]|nr:penicillin acylase family protein [Actinomycetota bacterium]
SSFVQAITWNRGRCPLGGSILTYSESENPNSTHHSDQTALFSRKQWVPDTFCSAAVLHKSLSTTVLEPGRRGKRTKKHH